jgi:hypothetical protein
MENWMTTIPVTQAAVRNLATALSKIDTSKLKHTERLELIAQAFGWKSDAFMHALKTNDVPPILNGSPPQLASSWRSGTAPSLQSLGIRQIDLWERLLAEPAGVIINTGATGSGRTTVIAASADFLVAAGRSVYTVADVTGLVPMSGNPVLIFGEIRDAMSAGEAFKYAESGFLVLAAMYGKNAKNVPAKLQDFDVSQSRLGMLRGAMSQTLLRRVDGGRVLVSRVKVFGADTPDSDAVSDGFNEGSGHFTAIVDELVAHVRAGVVEEGEVERVFGPHIRSHVSAVILGFKLVFAGSDLGPMRRLAHKVFENHEDYRPQVALGTEDSKTATLAEKLGAAAAKFNIARRGWPF